jgi:hypothetical protein
MKKRIFITGTLIYCFIVSFKIAAGLTGSWEGTVTTPDGMIFPLTYVLKADSGKLTGTVVSQQGEFAIENGKTDGTNFTFSIFVNGSDLMHTGKYFSVADSASLDIDYGGQKLHTTLKRKK